MSFWDNVKKFAQPYDDDDYDDYDEELDEFEDTAAEAAPRTRRPSPFASTSASTAAPAAPAEPETPKATAPGVAGQIKLHDVEPKTAAMLMAITANKLGKPINELRFISIKEVE